MNMKNIIIVVIAIVVAVVVSVSVTYYGTRPEVEPEPEAPVAPDKIVIGCSQSLSGSLAPHSEYSRESFELWEDKVNGEGGIYVKEFDKKIPVEVKYYDDKSDSTTVVRLYEKLITEDKVNFLLGAWGSGMNTPVAPLADKYQIPMIIGTGASVQLYTRGQDYLFYTGVLGKIYSRAPIEFFETLEPPIKTIAIAYLKTPAYEDSVPALVDLINKHEDWQLVALEGYDPEAVDLSPLITKLKALDPDVVINPDYFADGILFMKQAKELGLRPRLFFNYICHMTDTVDALGIDAEGWYGIQDSGWNIESGENTVWYLQEYEKRYGRKPNPCYSGFPYAALQIYRQAIERAGTLDPEAVYTELRTGKFKTLWDQEFYFGTVTMDGQILKWMWPGQWGACCQIQNGEILFVAPPKAGETEPWYPYDYFSG